MSSEEQQTLYDFQQKLQLPHYKLIWHQFNQISFVLAVTTAYHTTRVGKQVCRTSLYHSSAVSYLNRTQISHCADYTAVSFMMHDCSEKL